MVMMIEHVEEKLMEVTCWICKEKYEELHPERVGFSGNRVCTGCRGITKNI